MQFTRFVRHSSRRGDRPGRHHRVPALVLRLAAIAAFLAVGAASPARPATAADNGYRIVWDDFSNGFAADSANAKWFHFATTGFIGDDGIVSTSNQGLRVISSGVNPVTGQPAFTKTVPQDQPGDTTAVPGGVDHVKWLVYMNHISSHGYPGFDAVPGQALSCESWISGRTYGTEAHPFGAAVAKPNDDLRLASFAMNNIDFETFMVFDMFATNERIYAFYERLPFGRGGVLGNYAAFSYAIPVATRTPGDQHHLAVSYDKAAGTVRWFVDDRQVFEVNRIGYRIDRQYMLLDHGGVEGPVSPNQLDCGMGMFTLLDAHSPAGDPTGRGLVKLSAQPNLYFNPATGAPATDSYFVDPASAPSSRLFGQGAELHVLKSVVASRPTK